MRVRGYAPATPCWTVLTSSDTASSVDFYGGLFGWTTAPADDGTTTFLRHDLAVAGLAAAPGRPSAWLTYVSTEDIEATAVLVGDAGGTVLLPPAQAGTRGRSALFADATGAVFGAWQRGTFAGAQVANESNTICWSEIVTADVPAAVSFYGKVFGWTERSGSADAHQEYHEWVATNRVVGGMSLMGEHYPPGTPAHWRTIVLVDDCAATAARAAELGGRLMAGPVDAGVGLAAFLLDPTGAALLAFELIPELRDAMG
ncbi:VOC family protein [Dactylosporangium sp. NPDC050688]|uniref:VOC family protein n=1 Tax=Dactylosporangium sp. NPDC050688 TaxID=3157217 RepID=UPI0033CE63DC